MPPCPRFPWQTEQVSAYTDLPSRRWSAAEATPGSDPDGPGFEPPHPASNTVATATATISFDLRIRAD